MTEQDIPLTPSGRPVAYMRMAELLMGSRIFMALRIAVDYGIADLLRDEARTINALAAEAGLPEASLLRLLRALSHVGVFHEEVDGRFRNSTMSAYLRADADLSLRELSLVLNDDAMLRAWQQLDKVLRTGQPAFAEVNGQTSFAYFAADPVRSANFARLMKGVYGPEGARIAAGFPFGRFSRLIDVGGGAGHILADILREHPTLQGAVLDLPSTAEVAREFLGEQRLATRASVIAGDFFHSVPAGFDAIFLKSVLHDWTDRESVRILRRCEEALPAEGRVLVTEIVLEPGQPTGHPHPLIDLEMMVGYGGKERTAGEFAALLDEAGLRLVQVHAIAGSFFSIVEAARR